MSTSDGPAASAPIEPRDGAWSSTDPQDLLLPEAPADPADRTEADAAADSAPVDAPATSGEVNDALPLPNVPPGEEITAEDLSGEAPD